MDSDRDTSKIDFFNFNDESILSTPLPQATSTVDKRFEMLLPEHASTDLPCHESQRESGYLSDGIQSLNKLQEELKAMINNPNITKPSDGSNIISQNEACHLLLGKDEVERTKAEGKLAPSLNQVTVSSLPFQNNSMAKHKLSTVTEEFLEDRPVSLPMQGNEKPTDSGRRVTYASHDNLDIERQSAREKALKTLAYEDLHLGILRPEEPNQKQSFSINQLEGLSIPGKGATREQMSGFSELLHESDLQREELHFAENALPLKSNDISLTGINDCSRMTEYFGKRSSESFFDSLSSSTTPFFPHSSCNISKNDDDEKKHSLLSGISHLSLADSSRVLREINGGIGSEKNHLNDLNGQRNNSFFLRSNLMDFIPTASLEDSLSLDVPRVSEIAKVLRNTDVEATPISLVKKVLGSHKKISPTRDSSFGYSRNVSDCSSVSFNDTETEKHYELKVVYGGGVSLELNSQVPLKDCTWTVQKVDNSKVLYNIKEKDPSTVEIPLLPKVKENIEVRILELALSKHIYTFHNISLIVEPPKVHFNGVKVFDFGIISECTSQKIPFILVTENSNMVSFVPMITQDKEILKIEFDGFEPKGNIDIYPEKPITGHLILSPTYGFCSDPSKLMTWQSSLKLCLSRLLNFEVIQEVQVKADIFKCSIMIYMESKSINMGENREVLLKNQSPCDITMIVTTTGRFIASAPKIKIPARSVQKIMIEYVPLTHENSEGELLFVTTPGDLHYRIKMFGIADESNFKPMQESVFAQQVEPRRPPSTASANSSMCLSSSSYEVDGPLQLLSSQKKLVWSSRTVGCDSACIKTVLFIAKADRKEKLIFEVLDPTGSFQLVVDGKRKQSLITTVSSNARREIAVDFTPLRHGQIKGQLAIKRFNSEVKEFFDLYGHGGVGRLQVELVDYDLDGKSFQVTLDAFDKKGHFTLQNTGDGTAFYKIGLKNIAGLFVEISPTQGLLSPGEKTTVSVSLSLERVGPGFEAIEGILKRNKNSEILLLTLSILFGDQPTRLRITRIYKKYKKDPQFVKAPLVSAAVQSLCDMFPSDKMNKQSVNLLKDPLSSAWDLFETGINEWCIRVVIGRNVLEDIILDSTHQFVSLHESHTLDETECSTVFDPDSFLHSSQKL